MDTQITVNYRAHATFVDGRPGVELVRVVQATITDAAGHRMPGAEREFDSCQSLGELTIGQATTLLGCLVDVLMAHVYARDDGITPE